MIVLVTGASGFIGRHMVAYLATEGGYRVRAGSRNPDAAPDGSEACRLDVLDPASLEAAMGGSDAVVHCAVGDRATTVSGTANVLRAAQRVGIGRVVHLSSISVYGTATGKVSETTPMIAPAGSGYAHWKSAAEAACGAAVGSGQDVVVLRPTIVYGAGSTLWVQQLAHRIISGRWGSFGEIGEGFCNLVHVRDVCAAALAALRSRVSGGVFNINGPDIVTWNAWFQHFATAIGHPNLPQVAPAAWRRRSRTALPAKALIRFVPVLQKPLTTFLLGAPARSELALFALKAIYSSDLARLQIAWRPQVGLTEGTQDACDWLRQTGIIG